MRDLILGFFSDYFVISLFAFIRLWLFDFDLEKNDQTKTPFDYS